MIKFDHEKLEFYEISSQSWKNQRQECHNHNPAPARNRNTVKIENRYRYTSREFVETNLYYYRARHMRPDLGRFISMDPLRTIDGTNMFGYVKNNPIILIDKMGYEAGVGGIWGENNPRPPMPPVPPRTYPNGNRAGSGGANEQDWICSKPMGLANLSLCLKKCCIVHDYCYQVFECNASSWWFSFYPGFKPCWMCNRIVVGCFALAATNPLCYLCVIIPETPSGPGPGWYPGGPGGSQWN